jgi:putative exosortase-associated protein (TIGR04073 family)
MFMLRHLLAPLKILLCLFILIGIAVDGRAERSAHDMPPDEVVGAMSNKLVRGVANVATGWVELPKQIVVTFKEEGAVKGIFVGPLKGIGMTLVRTVSGVVEVATFIVPFPGCYDPYFDPEYVWQGWSEEETEEYGSQ